MRGGLTESVFADRVIAHDPAPSPTNPLGGWPKRVVDLTIASAALLLLSPLMTIIIVMIKIAMGGPIFFVHSRVGQNGRTFRCYKFRTMARDADGILSRHLRSDLKAALEWQDTQKLRHDPRVTLLGHALRKSSLDELPQLINVLRGDMSCVGPRPITVVELERYGSSACEYFRARPGLTGIWQTSGRNRLDYAQRVTLDCYYVRHWSLWLDVAILIKTIPALLSFDQTS